MDQAPDLDSIFAALSDPTRRAVLLRLRAGEATVGELAEPFALSQPAISKHLKALAKAGLVERSRQAQRRPCRLAAAPLLEASRWLSAFLPSGEEPPGKKKKKKKRGKKDKKRS